jgi:hypothetical protein
MAYTKTHDPWVAGNAVSLAALDNFETLYTEISSYLASHTHDASYYTKTEMEATFWYAGNDGHKGDGSGPDVDYIYKSGGNMSIADFAGAGIPTGLVIWWYGAIALIPDGWQLADGTNGTIDLRDRMVVGAGTGSAYSPGDTGGSATFTATGTITVNTHALTEAEMAAHTHPYIDTQNHRNNYGDAGTSRCRWNAGSNSGDTASAGSGTAHGHSTAEGTAFTGVATASLPFCLALAFIQKV